MCCSFTLASVKSVFAVQVLAEVPADEVATVEDARLTPAAAALADGRGELTALALWLLAERAAVRLPYAWYHLLHVAA